MSTHSLTPPPVDAPEEPADAALLEAVRGGDEGAFADLWSRHVAAGRRAAARITSRYDPDDLVQESFARILSALRGGNGPRDAFRPYLYAVIRRVSQDWAAGSGHIVPVEDLELVLAPADGHEDDALEWAVTRDAFTTLRTEWREVLWYTEVEGLSAQEVGSYLGLSANSAAALAYRAREGLRTAWLHEHVDRTGADGDCAWAVDHLARYERAGLGSRDRVRIEEHLDTCPRCRARMAEVGTVAGGLRGVLLPAVVLIPAAKGAPVLAATAGGSVSVWLTSQVRRLTSWPTAGVVVAVPIVAAAVAVAAVLGGEAPPAPTPTPAPVAAPTAPSQPSPPPTPPPDPEPTEEPPPQPTSPAPEPTPPAPTSPEPTPPASSPAPTPERPEPTPTVEPSPTPPPTTSVTTPAAVPPPEPAPFVEWLHEAAQPPVAVVSGTTEATVRLDVDGTAVRTVQLSSSGTRTVPLTGLSSGEHVLTVRYVDEETGALGTPRVLTFTV